MPVSTHSRSKAAARPKPLPRAEAVFQLTAARRRLRLTDGGKEGLIEFQLTAARRRLHGCLF